MDDKNFYEMFAKAQQMIKSGNVPKEVKDMANQIQQNQQSQLNQQNLHNQQIGNISQSQNKFDKNLPSFNNTSNINHTSSNNNNMNFDITTMMKIKQMMDTLNSKSDDDLTNLLYAIKPYLRNEKKEKIDEYIKLLRMGKMAELFNKMEK